MVCASDVLGQYFTHKGSTDQSTKMPDVGSDEEKRLLKVLMQKLYDVNTQKCTAALQSHLARVKANPQCE